LSISQHELLASPEIQALLSRGRKQGRLSYDDINDSIGDEVPLTPADIEQVFEIPGMGRLSLEAIVGRDYPTFMGILALTSILGLLGNILSDFCYVLIDPRINFQA